jgi:hypothetical protein
MSSLKLSTFHTWTAMLNRCNSPKDARYKDYGERGITVCKRWLNFNDFLADMGERPSQYLQLDRINNNKGYCKENCRWATSAENNANKRLYSTAVNNTSGLTGVSITKRGYWRAFSGRDLLYQGTDFFEACCARKSWEAKKLRTETVL